MSQAESKPLLLAAAAAAGAGGLAAEGLLISSLGLLLGQGRAGAVGLTLWIAGWALGAWLAGRTRRSRGRGSLALAGMAAGLAIPLAFEWIHSTAQGGVPLAAWPLVGVSAVLIAAVPQGFFLPLLSRCWSKESGGARDVSWLFAANLGAAVASARLISFELAGAQGLQWAIVCAGALSLGAGCLGWCAVPTRISGSTLRSHASTPPSTSRVLLRRYGAVVALVTAWLAGIEWLGLRIGAVWLGGMQLAVTDLLVGSLGSLALGAALFPRILRHPQYTPLALVALACAGTAWILFPASSAGLAGEWPRAIGVMVLVGPALMPLGAVLPCLHRSLAGGESGRRLGDLIVYEVLGAAVGIPLLHWVVLPHWGTASCLGFLATLAIPSAFLVLPRLTRGTVLVSLMALATLAFSLQADEPVLSSRALSNPAFTHLSFAEGEHFAVTVVDDGVRGERTLLTDDFRATAVGDDYLYMRVLGHLPVLLHPRPERVAVLAFGTGTSAGAVAAHPEVTRVDLLEISEDVIAAAPYFEEVNHGVAAEGLPGLLDGEDECGRIVLRLGDGRRTLHDSVGLYDIITMEPLLPDSPVGINLYTKEFYSIASAALAPGGLLCQWVPPHALEPKVFDAVLAAFVEAIPWSGVFLFGTQVVLIGGQAEPALLPRRFPREDSELFSLLAPLGLDRPSGVLARFVLSGESWPQVERPLTDTDPWILFGRSRSGAERLSDLPINLGRLRSLEGQAPLTWIVSAGPEALDRLKAVRTLHRARESWQRRDLLRRGVELELAGPEDSLEELVAQLSSSDDPEVLLFGRLTRFEGARTGAVSDLAQGRFEEAMAKLIDAIDLRPQRGDLHLYMALAAQGLEEPAIALRAWERALALCPRILETPQGLIAQRLGLRFPSAVAGG